MRRSLVLAMIVTLGQSSMAMAGGRGGETLLQSGQRIITRQTRAAPAATTALATTRARADAGHAALQGPTTLAQSGIRARNKFLIGLGIAAAFVGVALVIDGGVEDSTPSSRGER